MDKNVANNLIVGVVVTVGFLALLFILFNISGGAGFFSSQYTLYGKFRDVMGLHSGSTISLAGLRVGVVKKITISEGNDKHLIVELSISSDVRERIREDSVATIRTQGVLGDKYIEITIGSPSEPVLEPGSYIHTQVDTDLFTKGGNLVQDLNKEFEEGGDIKVMLQNINQLVSNLNTITSDIRRQQGLLHAMIYGQGGQRLNASLEHLESILRKIEKGEGTLGALINDPTVYEDVKSMMGGAKRNSILKYFMREFIQDGEKARAQGEEETGRGE